MALRRPGVRIPPGPPRTPHPPRKRASLSQGARGNHTSRTLSLTLSPKGERIFELRKSCLELESTTVRLSTHLHFLQTGAALGHHLPHPIGQMEASIG